MQTSFSTTRLAQEYKWSKKSLSYSWEDGPRDALAGKIESDIGQTIEKPLMNQEISF